MNQQKEKFQLTNWELVSVNPSDKTWKWTDYFYFWAVNIQSLIGFSLIASLYILYDLNFIVVLSGTIFASILIYFFSNLIGKISQKHGIPFPVLLRISIGLNAARYFGFLRGLLGIFFFGVQTFFISKSIVYLIRISLFYIDREILNNEIFLIFFLSLNIIDWIALLFTFCLQYLLFTKGHYFLRSFTKFSAIFVYFGLLVFLIMVVSENSQKLFSNFSNLISLEDIFNNSNMTTFISVTGTMFAYFAIVLLSFGDFSRYAKDKKELNLGNLSLLINLLLFSFFAVLITLGADMILNNINQSERLFTNPTDIIGKIDNPALTVFALLFIMVASLSTNFIANYIPSQNTLLNFLPNNLNLKTCGILIMFIASFVAIFWLPVLSQIGLLSFIDTVGSIFGPLFGLIVCDYYLIKRKKIINKDIFLSNKESAYFYSNGWHLKAIYSVFIGFIFASSTIWNVNLQFLQTFSWIIGAFTSYVTYYFIASKK